MASWYASSCSTRDGCAANCLSDETCGNGVLDPGEACDDGNLRSHDGCSSGCTVDTLQWVEVTPTNSPSARRYHRLVFDADRSRIVLFGGEPLFGMFLGDTWEYDGIQWTEIIPPSSPSALLAPA